ncbi:MAG: CapA family protein [Chloroflexota bacterium]
MLRSFLRTAVFLFILLAACKPAGAETAVSPPDLSAYPWVYLRDGQALAADEPVVSLLAVGDVLLGRGVLAEPEPLAEAAWLGAADLTLGNLEGVITNNQQSTENSQPITDHGSRITLTMPPTAVTELQAAGFDLLGLANNHSLDMGPAGLAETAVHLERAGLVPIGLQTNAVVSPAIRVVNKVRLAFFAFNAIPDPEGPGRCQPSAAAPCPVNWDAETAVPAIQQAKTTADAVIVSIHWGFEYETLPDPAQERMAAALRAAGADLVLGHHPHTAQPIAVDDSGVVAYSLGNFVFDQETAVTQQGLALLAYFDADGLRAVQALPVQAGLQPRLLALDELASWLCSVLPPPRLAFACNVTDCVLEDAPGSTESGTFYSGQIDLTGDGKGETIRREGEQITIYEEGTAVWQSPVEWRVVDAALGDPNDDGRFELMLAIWRKDGAGYERSQPYMVGHRGGEYALLWGGRPVVDPIQELALADVDGDGIEELVVIIEQADGLAQSVAVWQWQGWTFSLQWQSEPGWYEDLVIQEGEERPLIAVYRTGEVERE